MKKTVVIILLFWFCLPVFGQPRTGDPAELFRQGKLAYRESRFAEAIDAYEAMLRMGWESGNLYYNLGNAYFKAGKPGKAVLNYERAGRLLGNDADLRANLEYAQSLLSLGPEKRLPDRALRYFSADQLTRLAMGFYLGLVVFAGAAVISGKRFYRMLALVDLAFLLIVAAGWAGKLWQINQKQAVIVEETESKFAPAETAVKHFSLPEGDKVTVIDKSSDWLRVRTADKKTGWIKKDAAEAI